MGSGLAPMTDSYSNIIGTAVAGGVAIGVTRAAFGSRPNRTSSKERRDTAMARKHRRVAAKGKVHRGPRGGRYRIHRGRKVYL